MDIAEHPTDLEALAQRHYALTRIVPDEWQGSDGKRSCTFAGMGAEYLELLEEAHQARRGVRQRLEAGINSTVIPLAALLPESLSSALLDCWRKLRIEADDYSVSWQREWTETLSALDQKIRVHVARTLRRPQTLSTYHANTIVTVIRELVATPELSASATREAASRVAWSVERAIVAIPSEPRTQFERSLAHHLNVAQKTLAGLANDANLRPVQPSLEQIAASIEAALSETPPPDRQKAVHSQDFTFVRWFATEYTFALGVQSSAVEALWKEWKTTGLGLHQGTIGKAVDAERDNFRMDTAFRNHPALGTMIQSCGDGKYKLAPPAAAATDATGGKRARITARARPKRR